jgi:hypothetical protein
MPVPELRRQSSQIKVEPAYLNLPQKIIFYTNLKELQTDTKI